MERKSQGITLIALIITIIIMLILAGIVWYVFSKDGPIEHARYTKFVTEFRTIEEKVELYVADQRIKQIEQIHESNIESIILPVGNKVTNEEKENIIKEKQELQEKMKELSGKEIEDIDLYWIDQEKINMNYKEKYLIDVTTRQIYQYNGQKIYGLIWHTLDEGVKIGKIQIIITPPKVKTTEVKISIKYLNNNLKQYKIGKNTTNWNEYTQQITLTSKDVLENEWNNEDKTVTLYVKGIDEEGREFIEEFVITNLDIDLPNAPIIESNFGYPVITPYGIGYSKDNIKYDTRDDIINYYSVDNGVTWKQYTGEISLTGVGIIKAKSVKKESGLEVISTKQVTIEDNVLPMQCYDEDEATGEKLYGAKILVDEEMIGKQVRVLVYSYEGGAYIRYISALGRKDKRANNM